MIILGHNQYQVSISSQSLLATRIAVNPTITAKMYGTVDNMQVQKLKKKEKLKGKKKR